MRLLFRGPMRRWIWTLTLVLPLTAQDRKAETEILKDLEFGKGGDETLTLDMYRPQAINGRRLPAVIFIHGGGWMAGNKRPMPLAPAAASRGYIAVSISYRLTTRAPFPAQVEDCKCAVRWLRANAEKYGVDPDRIGVWGMSAGGHLALMTGCADGFEGSGGKVQCVVAWFAPTDFSKELEQYLTAESRPLLEKLVGGDLHEKQEVCRQASPTTHVSKDDPPTLLVHGDRDTLVPLMQAERMEKKMKEAGCTVELLVVRNAGHGFWGRNIDPDAKTINRKCFEWLDRYLKK